MSKPVVRKTVEIHLKPRARGRSLQHESFYQAENQEVQRNDQNFSTNNEDKSPEHEERSRSQSFAISPQKSVQTKSQDEDDIVTSSAYDEGFVRQQSRNFENMSKQERNDAQRRFSHQPRSTNSPQNNSHIVGSLTRRTPSRRPESANIRRDKYTKPRRPESADNNRRALKERELAEYKYRTENKRHDIMNGKFTADDVKTPRTVTREEAQLYARTPLVDSPSDDWYVSGSRAHREASPVRNRSRSAIGILDFSETPINELLMSSPPEKAKHDTNIVHDPSIDTNFRFTDTEIDEKKPPKSRGRRQRDKQSLQTTYAYESHEGEPRHDDLIYNLKNDSIRVSYVPSVSRGNSAPGDDSSLRRRKLAVAGNVPVKPKKKVSFSDDEYTFEISPKSSPSQQRKDRTMSSGDDDMELNVDLSALSISKPKRRGRATRRKYSLTIGLFGQKGDRDSSLESERESLDSPDLERKEQIRPSNYMSRDQSESSNREQIPYNTTHRPNKSSLDHIGAQLTSTDSDSAYGGSPTLQQNFHVTDRSTRKARSYSLQPQNFRPSNLYVNEDIKRHDEQSNNMRAVALSEAETNTEQNYPQRRTRSRSLQHYQPEQKTRRRSALEILQPKVTMQLDPLLPESDDVFIEENIQNQRKLGREVERQEHFTSEGKWSHHEHDPRENTSRPKSSLLGFSRVTQLEITADELNMTKIVELETEAHSESKTKVVERESRSRTENRTKTVQFVDQIGGKEERGGDKVVNIQKSQGWKDIDKKKSDYNNNNNYKGVNNENETSETNADYLKELERRREMLEREQQRMQEEIERLRQEQKKIIEDERDKVHSVGSASSEGSVEVNEPPLTDSRRIDPQTLLKLVAAEERYWKTNMGRQKSEEDTSDEYIHEEEKYWENKLQKIRKEKSNDSLDELVSDYVTERKDARGRSDVPQSTMNEEWYKTLPRKVRNRKTSQPVGQNEQEYLQNLKAEEEFLAQEAERLLRKKAEEQSKIHVEPNIIITSKPLSYDDKKKSVSQPTWLDNNEARNPVQRNWSLRETSMNQSNIPNGGLNIPRSDFKEHPSRDNAISRCASCNEPVNKDVCMYVAELNKYWHTLCFRCTVCQTQLSNGKTEAQIRLFKSRPLCSSCDVTKDASGRILCSQI